MLIETLCGFIFGIDQHGEHPQFDARGTEHCIAQKHAAKTFTRVISRHRKPSQ